MRAAKYLDEKSNLTARNRLLQFAVVALVLAEAVQGVTTFRALRYQRTLLIPASLNHPVEFVGDRASPEYVREFARYTVGLALNVTPATASANFEELLTLYSAVRTGRLRWGRPFGSGVLWLRLRRLLPPRKHHDRAAA